MIKWKRFKRFAGRIRDDILKTAKTKEEYFNNDTQTYSPGLGIASQSKGIRIKTNSTIKKSEKQVRDECIPYLKSKGWQIQTIYTGPVFMGNKLIPNPAKGIPDVIAFNFKLQKMIFIEWKNSQGGVISQDQLNWHAWLRKCGQEVYLFTSLKEVEMFVNKYTKENPLTPDLGRVYG